MLKSVPAVTGPVLPSADTRVLNPYGRSYACLQIVWNLKPRVKQTRDLDGQPEESTLNIDNLEEICDLKRLFPAPRLFSRTERWRQASERNLTKAPRRRSYEKSGRIKCAVYEWCRENPETRITQQELAHQLGVSKQYVNRVVLGNVSAEAPQLWPPKPTFQPIALAPALPPPDVPRTPPQFKTVAVNQFGQPFSGGSYHSSFRTPGPHWVRRLREPT